MKKLIFFVLTLTTPFCVYGDEPLNSILIYDDGNVQVSSEISPYETLTPGAPILGSIIVTHNSHNTVDIDTFKIGDKPLKVTFLQSTPMTSNSPVVVSIYTFQLEGMVGGFHTLPAISVRVNGKQFQSPPLSIQVGD